ncbi:DUF5753 domain-containing protein [Nocardia sp. NPDC057668]|uniref:DUF5753 domain-containing protein n=1 Tax=Nocardia sp. NPDC057668 TaxID=3346202 RepID=UPI00366B9764
MEDGIAVKVSTLQYRELLSFYGADQATADTVLGLIREVKAAKGDPKGGWWRAYSDLVASHFDHYMSLEEACDRSTTFQAVLLPGLLQTAAYRRAITLTADPDMSAVDVERRIELAARRRVKVEAGGDFEMNVLLSESVLRHRIGGPAVMAEQLHHLAEVGRLPGVSIRVVPESAGSYLGLVVGPFTLFEFPRLPHSRMHEPPVVFVECYEGALFHEDADMVERYRRAVRECERVALDQGDTRQLILAYAKEFAA